MCNIFVDTLEVAGLYPAIMGMRNPKDSWEKSDSGYEYNNYYQQQEEVLGEQDLILAQKLIKAGSEHRKFMRQIQVWADVIMPRYIWQELDTYKFGTKNSCSTMHTIMKKPITMNDFYLGSDPIIMTTKLFQENIIPDLNYFRDLYLESKDYRWVKEMKRVLPESFIQMRTWNTNYEELRNIYWQRKNHRLNQEWTIIIEWIESLPYAEELILCK